MATTMRLGLDEYLKTSYQPDREYIDGGLKERHAGKWEHARLQALLTIWFGQNESRWGVMVSTEQRTRVTESRVRIPDLVIVPAGPQLDVLEAPPLLVVEILSPDDTYSDTQKRARDYLEMGVETVWIIDPETRSGRICIGKDWLERDRLEVPNTAIHVELAEMFCFLDKSRP